MTLQYESSIYRLSPRNHVQTITISLSFDFGIISLNFATRPVETSTCAQRPAAQKFVLEIKPPSNAVPSVDLTSTRRKKKRVDFIFGVILW